MDNILSSIESPDIEQLMFYPDLTGFVRVCQHDMSRVQPPLAEVDQGIHAGGIQHMKETTARPVFAKLAYVKIGLLLRYDPRRWDMDTARNVAETFLHHFRLFFIVWETRGILDLWCETPYGHYTLPTVRVVAQAPGEHRTTVGGPPSSI